MKKIFDLKRTDYNPSKQNRRVITNDDGAPLYMQSFLCSYECVIPDEKSLKKGKEWLQQKLRFNGYTKDKIKVGKNLIIYWEDSGSGSFQVINDY